VVTICTACFTLSKLSILLIGCTWFRIFLKTTSDLFPLNNISRLIFAAGMQCVSCEVKKKKKKRYPYNRPWRPIGLWDVEAPTFSRQSAHRWRWSCQLYVPVTLYPPGRFLVLISFRGWVDASTIVRLEWLGKLKDPPHRDSKPRPSGF
jgi:hypothetical protein